MHLSKPLSWKSVMAIALVAAALPTFAQKHRAVRHPSPAGPPLTVTASGTILDAVTGQPVAFAEVKLGNRPDKTDRMGKFKIPGTVTIYGSGDITASRSGYTTGSQTISTAGAHNITIHLQPTPTVTLRLVSGTQHQIDFESIEFGFIPAFGSYVKSSTEDFCRADGTTVQYDKGQMARLVGPATLESQSACCPGAPLLKVTTQLKTGETLPLFFTDSCDGYMIDFIGRDHTTGDFVFAKFSDIAEIIFP